MTHLIILLDIIQKDRHKFSGRGWKKNDMNLYFKSSRIILRQSFFAKKLTAKSFILDILPGFKYASDERNRLFSFK